MSEPVPQGIEVLVKKASVDAEFRELLLTERMEAARQIALELTPAEAMMLQAVPRQQLEAIIVQVTVPQEHRRAFLGKAAAAMVAVLGVTATASNTLAQQGARPAPPLPKEPDAPEREPDEEPKPDDKSAEKKADEKPAKKEPDALEKQVIDIVAKQLAVKEPKDITRDKLLVKDLDAKPRTLVSLRKALETKFKIKLTREAYKKVETVGDLIGCVRQEVDKKPRPPLPPLGAPGGMRPDRPKK